MTSIKLTVTGASIHAEVDGQLTAGMVGVPVTIEYDSAWDGLTKTLVCRSYTGGARTILNVEGSATVAPEVLCYSKYYRNELELGIEGRNAGGSLVIPTVWAVCGRILEGANADADPSSDPTLPVWAQVLEDVAQQTAPERIQGIVDDYLTENPPEVEEKDPTVPDWAKQPTKPTYTAAEVGALPDTYTPPDQTAEQVGADPAGTAETKVTAHNVDTAAHSDLRLELKALADRINAALDSDDVTLDQLSEIVTYIKSNKDLIDAITTSKVSVSDIVNDLVTNVANKPLSAAQGIVLKGLIDALTTANKSMNERLGAVETELSGVSELVDEINGEVI